MAITIRYPFAGLTPEPGEPAEGPPFPHPPGHSRASCVRFVRGRSAIVSPGSLLELEVTWEPDAT